MCAAAKGHRASYAAPWMTRMTADLRSAATPEASGGVELEKTKEEAAEDRRCSPRASWMYVRSS